MEGEETDGRAGPVPTIPRHDDAGKSPPLHTCCCVCLCAKGETPTILSE